MSDPCQPLQDQIAAAYEDLAAVSAFERQQLSGHALGPAPGGSGKGAEIKRITQGSRDLQQRIAKLEDEFVKCELAHGGKLDLTMNAAGNLRITMDGTDFLLGITMVVTFNQWHHTTWEIDRASIDPLPLAPSASFLSAMSNIPVSIPWNSGTFAPKTGKTRLHMALLFTTPWSFGDVNSAFELSSANPGGSPMDPKTREVTLTGSSIAHESSGLSNPEDGHPISLVLDFAVPIHP